MLSNGGKRSERNGNEKSSLMSDSPQDRLAKLLPGDVTAAFLSAKAALIASAPEDDAGKYVVWTFVAIIVLCPIYFRYVLGVTSRLHNAFLTLSFVVFGLSIANTEISAALRNVIPESALHAAGIVLPILWTYIVTQISVSALKYEDSAVLPKTP
jgi:hypothetical protein